MTPAIDHKAMPVEEVLDRAAAIRVAEQIREWMLDQPFRWPVLHESGHSFMEERLSAFIRENGGEPKDYSEPGARLFNADEVLP